MVDTAIKRESRAGHRRSRGMKGGVVIHRGTMVVLAAGLAQMATKAANLVTIGVADESVDNSNGGDLAKSVEVERRIFVMKNDATNPVTAAHIGSDCYIEDNETVTSDGTGSSVAGRVFDVDARGVSVEFL
ncbi:MAG: hypothetical protein JJ926_03850 [Roseitalea sp.]|nr:hypothetical protein [Roseitalea sp.]MBO6950990.1 hypothetical protein [Rhizobiaceae bacterium]MBO6591023.1 hypothetical protein [Roseitalea sp.]MBO6599719.1 hypothetical protein [Roseitalea sp.]MBO6611475.1 hypothetical protein [Roseitalea sp.]